MEPSSESTTDRDDGPNPDRPVTTDVVPVSGRPVHREGGSVWDPRRWSSRTRGAILAVYWMVLFAGTHIPLPETTLPQSSDKWAHVAGYALLAILLGAWWSARRPLGAKTLVVLFGVLAAYGIADELLQIPVNRTADILDWVADAAGAAIGLGLAQRIFKPPSSTT